MSFKSPIDQSVSIDICPKSLKMYHKDKVHFNKYGLKYYANFPGLTTTENLTHDCKSFYHIIDDELKTGEFWLKHNVEKSPADGHCFLHSVVRSSNAQHVNNVWLTLATLKRNFGDKLLIIAINIWDS